jgi:osmotically-inducible protein OsmY
VQTDLQSIIDRSSRLPSRSRIAVSYDGSVVVLRGEVRDEKERRLAEGILRLSPGVREIRNELTHPGQAAARLP